MKNYFLRCVSVLALFISCQSSLGAQKTVTPQMAIDVAKQLNSNSEYLYYYGKVPRVINDACGCHVTPTAFRSNPWLETQDSLWVVFIDQNPMSNWEHDCTFVYIPVNVTDLLDIPSFSVKGNRPPRHNIVDLVPWGKNGEGVNYITNTPEYVFAKEKKHRQSNYNDDDFFRGTKEGNKTYVAMVNCIQRGYDNYITYFNDMKYLYDVLSKKYGVPYYNFYIFMKSSVTANCEDYYNIPQGSFSYMNESSCGDSPTKKNFIAYLREQQVIPSECHLLLYFDGHGGYDEKTHHYYVAMMDGDLYDFELKQLLDSIPAKYQTIVMQNCYSGGFINELKAPGRTIITACAADECSESFLVKRWGDIFKMKNAYNVFSHMWTSALNGERLDFEYDNTAYYIEGSAPRPVNADFDRNGRVSLEETFISTTQNAEAYFQMEKEKGFRKNSNWEQAQYCSNPVTIGEDLSFNHIPDTVSLFVRDNIEDTGKEANTTTKVYWNSPDLWTSNSGTLTDTELNSLESVIEPITSRNETLYTYVRVTNRGICDYEGHGKYLHLMWSQPALNQTPAIWIGKDNETFGGVAASIEITQPIPVGESCIEVIPWQLPDAIYSKGIEQDCSFCFSLLTHISDSAHINISEISDSTDLTQTPVLQCRDMAQKSFQFYNPNGGQIDANSSVAEFAILPSESSKQLTVATVNDGDDLDDFVENNEFLFKTKNEIGISTLRLPASEKQNVTLVRRNMTNTTCSNESANVVHITLMNDKNKLVGGMSLICQKEYNENIAQKSVGLKIKSIENPSNGIIKILLTAEVPTKSKLVITSTMTPLLKTEIAIEEKTQNFTASIGNIPNGPCVVSLMVDGALVDSKQVIIK